MKKILGIIVIAVSALFSSTAFAADEAVDLKEEFRYDQEQALTVFVDAWIKGESDADLTKKYLNLIRANTRYRLSLQGPDKSFVGKVVVASEKGTDQKQKMNESALAYYADKGIVINTRSCFSKTPYDVKKK